MNTGIPKASQKANYVAFITSIKAIPQNTNNYNRSGYVLFEIYCSFNFFSK